MKSKSKAKRFLTIDAETDPFKEGRIPQPFIWGCYDGLDNDYQTFDCAADMVEFLRDKSVLVYAHNGGKFDFHYLRNHINADQPIMVISGRLASFKIGEAEFRDSMNILVNPLRAFAKEEIDYAKLEPDVRHLHMDEIKRYLRSDCVNLWETIKRYHDTYGRALTQAGSAMKYWKKNHPIDFSPQTAKQSAYYRDFYYGGRVECFETGHRTEQFEVVDINSAYPRAMLEAHPISPTAVLVDHLPAIGNMGDCFVRLEAIAGGCFPFKSDDGRLSFPNDTKVREYAITGHELQTALDLDLVDIRNVIEVRRFTQTVDFSDYVNHFWNERKNAKARGDKAADLFAKLFLNSLYGKFASDPEKYSEYVLATDESVAGWRAQKYIPTVQWGERFLCQRPLPEEKHRYFNVATAASITGWVRAYLMRGIAACHGVLYCDTDSIAARDVSGLCLGAGLGEWKHEFTGTEWAIAAKKTYAFKRADTGEWKTASKGVRLAPMEILRAAAGETIIHKPMVPTYSIHNSVPVFTNRKIKRTEEIIANSLD